MAQIADAAGLTKRTLYAWHADKEALFRACVTVGAQRFPVLAVDDPTRFPEALEGFAAKLLDELTAEDSFGMGLLFVRESGSFPELASIIQRGYFEYLVEPLAACLRQHGYEVEGRTERTNLFVTMVLAPVHNAMLLGEPIPGSQALRRHAALSVGIFLAAPVKPPRGLGR